MSYPNLYSLLSNISQNPVKQTLSLNLKQSREIDVEIRSDQYSQDRAHLMRSAKVPPLYSDDPDDNMPDYFWQQVIILDTEQILCQIEVTTHDINSNKKIKLELGDSVSHLRGHWKNIKNTCQQVISLIQSFQNARLYEQNGNIPSFDNYDSSRDPSNLYGHIIDLQTEIWLIKQTSKRQKMEFTKVKTCSIPRKGHFKPTAKHIHNLKELAAELRRQFWRINEEIKSKQAQQREFSSILWKFDRLVQEISSKLDENNSLQSMQNLSYYIAQLKQYLNPKAQ